MTDFQRQLHSLNIRNSKNIIWALELSSTPYGKWVDLETRILVSDISPNSPNRVFQAWTCLGSQESGIWAWRHELPQRFVAPSSFLRQPQLKVFHLKWWRHDGHVGTLFKYMCSQSKPVLNTAIMLILMDDDAPPGTGLHRWYPHIFANCHKPPASVAMATLHY